MTATDVSLWLDTLAGSHDRLCDLVADLGEDALGRPSYCDDWTIAQVLSHIGSGAEIMRGAVGAVVAGGDPPSRDTYPAVWDRWNAMAPREVRDAALSSDGELIERLEELGDALDELEFTLFGGMRVDAVGLLRLRLGEHALHTWDIAVALDPAARVDADAVALLVDRLAQAVTRLAKPERAASPGPWSVRIVTSQPDRRFRLDVADIATLGGADEGPAPREELHVSAEAFLRLVYGRLDPSHTPAVEPGEQPALERLRSIFPGF